MRNFTSLFYPLNPTIVREYRAGRLAFPALGADSTICAVNPPRLAGRWPSPPTL